MAIETFSWSPRLNAGGDANFRVREAQFDDGYSQVAGVGLNPKKQSWELNFVGSEAYIKGIKDFLDRHAGSKSFRWTPPLSQLGLFRCKGYKPNALGGGNYSLSATFEQAYQA